MRALHGAIDSGLTMLYWQIGESIRREVLKEQRAEYGANILQSLSAKLTAEFGRGFSEKSLRHMVRFAEVFPEVEIVSALLRQLSWTHFLSLIYLNDPLKRNFYAEMCRIEGWNTRTLDKKIQSMLFERTALSRKPEQLAEIELKALHNEDKLTPNWFSVIPTCWIFSGSRTPMQKKAWKLPSCGKWKRSFWSWASVSRFWSGKNGSPSMESITILTCCSITGTCDAWLLSS